MRKLLRITIGLAIGLMLVGSSAKADTTLITADNGTTALTGGGNTVVGEGKYCIGDEPNIMYCGEHILKVKDDGTLLRIDDIPVNNIITSLSSSSSLVTSIPGVAVIKGIEIRIAPVSRDIMYINCANPFLPPGKGAIDMGVSYEDGKVVIHNFLVGSGWFPTSFPANLNQDQVRRIVDLEYLPNLGEGDHIFSSNPEIIRTSFINSLDNGKVHPFYVQFTLKDGRKFNLPCFIRDYWSKNNGYMKVHKDIDLIFHYIINGSPYDLYYGSEDFVSVGNVPFLQKTAVIIPQEYLENKDVYQWHHWYYYIDAPFKLPLTIKVSPCFDLSRKEPIDIDFSNPDKSSGIKHIHIDCVNNHETIETTLGENKDLFYPQSATMSGTLFRLMGISLMQYYSWGYWSNHEKWVFNVNKPQVKVKATFNVLLGKYEVDREVSIGGKVVYKQHIGNVSSTIDTSALSSLFKKALQICKKGSGACSTLYLLFSNTDDNNMIVSVYNANKKSIGTFTVDEKVDNTLSSIRKELAELF